MATTHGGHWEVWADHPLLVPLVVAVPTALYLAGWWRLRRGGERGDALRLLAFLAGAQLLVVALISPLHHVATHYLLSAHMVQHVLVGDVAPLLIVAGLTGPMRGMLPPWLLRLAGPPWAALLAWGAATGLWYVPGLYDPALDSPVLHVAMQASFVLTGLALWAHILGVVERPMSSGKRAGVALGAMGIGWVVSQALFLTAPLYDRYIDQPERVFGLGPASDQIRASLIMGTEGMITMLGAAGLLIWSHLDATPRRREDVVPAPAPERGGWPP